MCSHTHSRQWLELSNLRLLGEDNGNQHNVLPLSSSLTALISLELDSLLLAVSSHYLLTFGRYLSRTGSWENPNIPHTKAETRLSSGI
jgi:hypothetical protein